MNAITRTTFVAVLAALGLALAVWAAEPPKSEPRKGNDAAGAVEKSMNRTFDDRDPAISFVGGGWRQFTVPGTSHHGGTSTSSSAAGDSFTLAHTRCTRLVWWATRCNDRGRAEVTLDGEKPTVVDQGGRLPHRERGGVSISISHASRASRSAPADCPTWA